MLATVQDQLTSSNCHRWFASSGLQKTVPYPHLVFVKVPLLSVLVMDFTSKTNRSGNHEHVSTEVSTCNTSTYSNKKDTKVHKNERKMNPEVKSVMDENS